MKKAIMILFLSVAFIFSCADISEAIDWKITNQVTIAWDAVATLSDGSAIPANHSLKYRVYLSNATTDPDKANPALLGETDQLQYVITLNIEGQYFAGASTVRYDESGIEINESDINWSDVNGEYTPNPFGLVHYLKAGIPKNLR